MTDSTTAVLVFLLLVLFCWIGIGGTCGGKAWHIGCDDRPMLHVEVP